MMSTLSKTDRKRP